MTKQNLIRFTLTLYFISFALPAVEADGTMYGLLTFIIAMISCFGPGIIWGFPWFANFFLMLGIYNLTLDYPKHALRSGALATGLGFCTFIIIDRVYWGYVLWQTSLLSFTLGTAYLYLRQPREAPTSRPLQPEVFADELRDHQRRAA